MGYGLWTMDYGLPYNCNIVSKFEYVVIKTETIGLF